MQIVIDIDEENYKSCLTTEYIRKVIYCDLVSAIRRGTILPKYHGRLIDADVIKDFKDRIKCYKEDYAFSQKEILNILERYEIRYAPTIIEAEDKE